MAWVNQGSQDGYRWLEADCDLANFLRLCPESVIGRRVAVTSIDSGVFVPDDQALDQGWTSHGGVAYSPTIRAFGDLPHQRRPEACGSYHEWYIFGEYRDLGELNNGNIFEQGVAPGRVFTFVNYSSFKLSNPNGLPELFWAQMDCIRPDAFLGESPEVTIFATCDDALFEPLPARLERYVNSNVTDAEP